MANQKRKAMFRRFMAMLMCVAVVFAVLPEPVLAGGGEPPELPDFYESGQTDYCGEGDYHEHYIWYQAKIQRDDRVGAKQFTVEPIMHDLNVGGYDKVTIRGRGAAVIKAEDTKRGGATDFDDFPVVLDIVGVDLDIYLLDFGKEEGSKSYKELKSLTAAGDNIHIYFINSSIKIDNDKFDSIRMTGLTKDGNEKPAKKGILEMYNSEVKGGITLNGEIEASLYNCTLCKMDSESILTAEYTMTAPVTLQDEADLSLMECTVYDINSEGHNSLSLKNTKIHGNIRVSGGNEGFISAGDSYREKNGLELSLAGENFLQTPHRTNGVGVCPDIMVAETSVLSIKDDPTEPDVGELVVGGFNPNAAVKYGIKDDGGHYYCAAIGGMPDQGPHGLIVMEGGILYAWAMYGGAAIGGSTITGFSRDGGRVFIRGGVVNVEAQSGGAAIGGAHGGNGGEFTIIGGTVNAMANGGATAIGGGERASINGSSERFGGSGGKITIQGACVVNCYSDNNAYTSTGVKKDRMTGEDAGDSFYAKGYVIGASERLAMTADDEIEIRGANGVSPVVILQQAVQNSNFGYSTPEIDASWDNFIVKNNNMSNYPVLASSGVMKDAVQIWNGMLILIGRDCVKNKDGMPVDYKGRPLMRKTGTTTETDIHGQPYQVDHYEYLRYDEEDNEEIISKEEYDPGKEQRDITTRVISGYDRKGNEIPLVHNNYKIRGQIPFPAWPDPWWSDENNTEFTLPEESTITLMDGAVMTVGEGFSVWGDEDQLMLEEGAVIQGRGIWPGKPMDTPNAAPDESQMKSILKHIKEKNKQENAGPDAGANRSIVTHLGIAKDEDDNRFIISGDSPEEIKSKAEDQGAEIVTIINAGYCGFEKDGEIWKLLQSYPSTVVSLVENGALSAIPGKYSTIDKKFNVMLQEEADEGKKSVKLTLQSAKLSSPDYVVFEGYGDDVLTIDFTPEDEYNEDLAFVAGIDPQLNKAVFSVPKFYNSGFELTTVAPLKDKCALRYGGELSFHTPIADYAGVDIEQLQINYGKKTTLGGIAGGGSVEVPAIGGFPVSGGAEMHLNTFDGEQEYSMSVELETPIFEGAFEATLKEARGVILPDTLYAELAVGEGGIPLVPPTVVGYLQGGGLGFEGLADTVNMNSFGAPPIRLKIAAKGSIIDVIDGWAKVSIGPSGFDLSLEDIEIEGLEFVKEFGLSASWDAGKRTIKAREYWGIGTDMSQYMVIGVALQDKDILSVKGTTAYGGFAGYVVDGDYAYFIYQLHASGTLQGSLDIPKGLVGPFPFHSCTLANAEAGYYAAANATSNVNKSKVNGSPKKVVKELAKNAKIDFDAAVGAKAVIGGGALFPACNVRIVYVFGDKRPSVRAGYGEGAPLNLEEAVGSGNLSGDEYTMLIPVGDGETEETIPAIVEVGAKTLASYKADRDGGPETIYAVGSGDGEVTIEPVGLMRVKIYCPPMVNDKDVFMKINLPVNKTVDDVNVTREDEDGKSKVVNLVEAEYDVSGNLINDETANCFMDEDGAFYYAPDGTGYFTIASDSPIDEASVIKMNRFATIKDATLNGSSVAYSLQDADVDHRYKVQFVLGEEKGAGDYLLSESEELTGSDAYNNKTLSYQLTGSEVPTGDYYPTLLMLEYMEAKDEATGESVETWTVVSQNSFDSTAHYTNNVVPAAPGDVRLEATGNETMTASWNEVNTVSADHVVYQVALYDEEDVDTGLGYTTSDNSVIMDLSAFEKNRKYSVGVKALIYEDARGETYQTSDEGKSGSVLLMEAAPPVITISGNVIRNEDQSYAMLVGENGKTFELRADKKLDFTVKDLNNVSMNQTFSSVSEASVNIASRAKDESTIFEIVGTDPETGDYAVEHINVTFDTTAPPLSLDNMGVFPLMIDQAGRIANIIGQSEAGASVLVWTDENGKNDRILAGKETEEDGSFNISLEFEEVPDPEWNHIMAQAVDRAGNLSDPVEVSFPDDTLMLTFDPNGEGALCATAGMSVSKNTVIGTLPTPYWDNDEYLFDGWYTDPDGGEEVTTAGTFEQDTILYAHWKQAVIISFDPADDNASCDISAVSVKAGEKPGELPVPVYHGEDRLFLGWYTDGGGEVTEDSTFDADTTLHARFSEYVTVSFNAGVGSCAVTEMQVAKGGRIDQLPVPVSNGYDFEGWYEQNDQNQNIILADQAYSADTGLVAKWIRKKADLAVTQEGCNEGEELPDPLYTKPDKMVGDPNISYFGTGDTKYRSSSKPDQPGTYKVVVQCDTFEKVYVGSAEFTITNNPEIHPTVSIRGWTYGEKPNSPSVKGNPGNGEVTYTYSVKGDNKYSTAVPTDAGDYTVKAEIAATARYHGGVATADFTIKKGTDPARVNKKATVAKAGHTKSLAGNVTGAAGELSFEKLTDSAGGCSVTAAGIFTSGAGTGTCTVRVTIADSKNYNGWSEIITVSVVDKMDAGVSFKEGDSLSKTYGDEGFTLHAEASNAGEGGRWTFRSGNPNVAAVGEESGEVKITGVGEAVITAEYESDLSIGEAEIKIKVTAKDVTITGAAAADKEYDTTTAAVISNPGTVNGAAAGDDVSVIPGTAVFSDKNVGSRTVSFNGFTLTGKKAGNYNLTAQPADGTANILPKTLAFSVTAESRPYEKGNITVGLKGGSLSGVWTGESVSADTALMKGTMADANAGNGKPVKVSGITLTGPDAGNYSLPQPEGVTVDITRAELAAPAEVTRTYLHTEAAKDSVELSGLLPKDAGTVRYNAPVTSGDISYKTGPELTGSLLSYELNRGGGDRAGVITVTATMQNYRDTALKVNVKQIALALYEKIGRNTEARSSGELKVDKSMTLVPMFADGTVLNQRVVWVSSNPAVAVVTQDGKVTARAGGSTVISVQSEENPDLVAYCALTVREAVTEVSLDQKNVSLGTGESVTVCATVLPFTAGQELEWKANNEKVDVEPSEDGMSAVITGMTAGKATVTATAKDGSGKKASCTFAVGNPVPDFSIAGKSGATELKAGKTLGMLVSWQGSKPKNAAVTWTVTAQNGPDASYIATVSDKGVLTGITAGKVTVTATSVANPEKSASAEITVTAPAKSNGPEITEIKFTNKDKLAEKGLGTGKSYTLRKQLTLSGTGKAAGDAVAWISSDSRVATVTQKGVVKAIAPGKVTITAIPRNTGDVSAAPGDSVTFRVFAPVKSVKLDKKKLTVGTQEGAQYGRIRVAKVVPENVSNPAIKWTVNNENVQIAAIPTDGFEEDGSFTGNDKEVITEAGETLAVQGAKPGVTKISGITTDGSKKKVTCTVTVRGQVTGLALKENTGKNGLNDVTATVSQGKYTGNMKAGGSMTLKPLLTINGVSSTSSDSNDKKAYAQYKKYTDTGVSYRSSDTSVATVNKNGKITIKKGTASGAKVTVYVSGADGKQTAEILITVP